MTLRLLVCLGLLWSGPTQADPARAYDTGAGLAVVVGGRHLDADGARLGCGGCHGDDGRGGREGGAASAPSILWSDLSVPTLRRPAYDEAAFLRALTEGVDPAGRRLQMPRFVAPPALLAGLRDHLTTLETRQRSGIDGLRIAVGLPRDPDHRAAVLAAIGAFNDDGGSWGRLIVPADPDRPWLLDLGAALDVLLPRLLDAERQSVARALSDDPDLKAIPPRDAGGALLLQDGPDLRFIGPPPKAVVWARRQGLSLDAARVFALTELVLEEMRAAGPAITRSDLERRLRDLDPRRAIASETIAGDRIDPQGQGGNQPGPGRAGAISPR